jgi:hypothetical protein
MADAIQRRSEAIYGNVRRNNEFMRQHFATNVDGLTICGSW